MSSSWTYSSRSPFARGVPTGSIATTAVALITFLPAQQSASYCGRMVKRRIDARFIVDTAYAADSPNRLAVPVERGGPQRHLCRVDGPHAKTLRIEDQTSLQSDRSSSHASSMLKWTRDPPIEGDCCCTMVPLI